MRDTKTGWAGPEAERKAVIASRTAYQFDCSFEVASCPYCDEHYCSKHAEQLIRKIQEKTNGTSTLR